MPLRTREIARVEGLVRTCSIWRALDVVGDVPVLLILQAIWLQEHRFSDIQRRTLLPKVLLSERLRRLTDAGLLSRRAIAGEGHPHYRLTGKGVALFPVTMMLQRWESRWAAEPRHFTIETIHRDCGTVTDPRLGCGACGTEADAASLSWHDGPGMGLMAPKYMRRRQARARAEETGAALLFTGSAALLGDRWASLIVRELMMGVSRFDDLLAETGMASNILSERLRWLADIAVIERLSDSQGDGRATYALTAKGADFVPVLIALQAWGDGHYAAPEGPPVVIRHEGCGAVFRPEIRCSACGGTLDIGNVMVRRSATGA